VSDEERQTAIAVALLSSRLAGCTCQPTVEVRRDYFGIIHNFIGHDTWCRLHPSRKKKGRMDA
jgi:hypothetical protein